MEDVLEPEASFSPGWWESRSNEQLQDMIRGGFPGGDTSVGAYREIERRARERTQDQRRQAQLSVIHKKRMWSLTGVEIAMLLALVAILLFR